MERYRPKIGGLITRIVVVIAALYALLFLLGRIGHTIRDVVG